jgi:hypothetical protein
LRTILTTTSVISVSARNLSFAVFIGVSHTQFRMDWGVLAWVRRNVACPLCRAYVDAVEMAEEEVIDIECLQRDGEKGGDEGWNE